jgi:hypothetical protein
VAPERRNQLVLGALAVVMAGVIYRMWPPSTVSAPAASNEVSASRPTQVAAQPKAPAVHLDALQAERPRPADADRNLFRFKTRPAPPRPVAVPPAPVASAAAAPIGPPLPPAVPPIALKFIGIVEAPVRTLKVAVLSDQYGVYYGREGETILGQYRILRIGAESLEISYVDGRGRQTIRLNGS